MELSGKEAHAQVEALKEALKTLLFLSASSSPDPKKFCQDFHAIMSETAETIGKAKYDAISRTDINGPQVFATLIDVQTAVEEVRDELLAEINY